MARATTITEHERIRRARGLGVVEFATATGYSHSYVSQVEHGRLVPSPEYRKAAAAVLGLPEIFVFPEFVR